MSTSTSSSSSSYMKDILIVAQGNATSDDGGIGRMSRIERKHECFVEQFDSLDVPQNI